jgi:thermitase
MTRLMSLVVAAFVLSQLCYSNACGQEPERIIGVQIKAASEQEKPGKLSRELAAVKLSGGELVANTPDGMLLIKGVQAKGLAALAQSALVKAIATEGPKERLPIEKLRLSYSPDKKPTTEELKKMDLAVVEDYVKGSFFVVKPTVPIAAPLLMTLEGAAKVTFVAPVMKIKAIPPLKKKQLVSRGGAAQIPNDPRLPDLWGIANVKASQAWKCVKEGPTIVAVIDTGVDYTHEDLRDTMWKNPKDPPDGVDNDGNGLVDDVHGADFVGGDGDPMDENGHGTHCAGTVSGVGNNGLGVVGMNWKTPIMALRWLDAGGFGSSVEAIKCIDYAVDHGARILSNSWWHPDDPELKEAIIRARDAGVLFIAAAGNFSLDNDDATNYFRYPSSYDVDNIISVAAIEQTEALADFSSFGVKSVDVGAPGVDVLSSVPGNQYSFFSGTSMATPHVAGAAALIWNAPKTGAASWTDVKNMILAQTRPLSSLSGKCVTGGTLDVSFLETIGCASSPTKCCPTLASGAFGWDEFKTVSSNASILQTVISLNEDSDVMIRCSTSARSNAPVTFSTGTFNTPDVNVMWTDSYRTITAHGSNTSVAIVTDMSIRLPKGKHTIYWRVWIYGGELQFHSGTMQLLAVPAGGASTIVTLSAAPVTRFGDKKQQVSDRKQPAPTAKSK